MAISSDKPSPLIPSFVYTSTFSSSSSMINKNHVNVESNGVASNKRIMIAAPSEKIQILIQLSIRTSALDLGGLLNNKDVGRALDLVSIMRSREFAADNNNMPLFVGLLADPNLCDADKELLQKYLDS